MFLLGSISDSISMKEDSEYEYLLDPELNREAKLPKDFKAATIPTTTAPNPYTTNSPPLTSTAHPQTSNTPPQTTTTEQPETSPYPDTTTTTEDPGTTTTEEDSTTSGIPEPECDVPGKCMGSKVLSYSFTNDKIECLNECKHYSPSPYQADCRWITFDADTGLCELFEDCPNTGNP